MSLAIAAAAALLIQPVCSWDRPGVDRYRGTPAGALANYRDIPAADRAVLARRIAAGTPDDTVQISRTAIAGNHAYESTIADMHFGTGRMCRSVTRAKWTPAHREPAAVYCVNDECVLVPQVCGNVSRVRRIVTSGGGTPGSSGGAPGLLPGVPAFPAAPVPGPGPAAYYPAVPSGGADLPPWAEPGAPLSPPPGLGYPGPGREVGGPLPLAPVPEPSTWAMLLGGIALLAARAWRRTKHGNGRA
ncbi:MAG TPA: MHFG family PEP-CTERM protein, partial [Pseudoduganella sp.]